MHVTMVTGNPGKQREWQRLVPPDVHIDFVDVDLQEIQYATVEEVVADKAKAAFEIVQKPVIVEDVAAGLDRLGGLPGPFIKFFVKKLGDGALRILAEKDGENATATCAVAYYDGITMISVSGTVNGVVTDPRGDNGFGFDKAFIPEGSTKTFGEMTFEEKDQVSHRSKAVAELIAKLREHSGKVDS